MEKTLNHHPEHFKRIAAGILGLTFLMMSPTMMSRGLPAPRYLVTDLGTLGGVSSDALGMNDQGQVVGWAGLPDGSRHAFLYANGTLQDLGVLNGGLSSYATAINDRSQVTGVSGINEFGPSFPEIMQGFIWDQGVMHSLGALFCPCSFNDRYGMSTGFGINDFGWVTGASETIRGSWVLHAVLWQDGQMQDLGGGAGDWSISRLFGVNDLGVMAGDYAADAGLLGTSSFDREASLWQYGARTGLGVLAGQTSSTALAVNWKGQVVGWSGTADASVSRAFIWDAGTMRDLGTLPGDANSAALAVNALGMAVGWSGAGSGNSHAVLWSFGKVVDLNTLIPLNSGWVLTEARAINIRGEIAGVGLHNGETHAFRLDLADSFPERRHHP
ncbi:MAG: hypothetical protein ACM3ZT_02205 [Bacillota bacterium]